MRGEPSAKRFAADRGGSVAIMFAAAVIPLVIGVGAAIDYSRAAQAKVDMQAAVDATALAVGRVVMESGQSIDQARARASFDAGFKRSDGTTVTRFAISQNEGRLVLEVEAKVPLVFAGILGRSDADMGARAEVPLDVTTVEVALVLDNTGSMSSSGKMTALKDAAKSLIDTLQNASYVSTKAEVAIVPFATQVNVGTTIKPNWVRIRATETETKLNLNGQPWAGCVFDRDQDFDVREDRPNTLGDPETEPTLYPAAPCQSAGLAPIMPLTRDFAALRTAITNMNPTGATNTTIGLAWGLNVLNPGAPLSATARPPGKYVKKHIVFLTDGLNTENRFSTVAADIDPRMQRLCDEAKKSPNNIVLHTIRVIEGNETLLRNCATTPERYYSITDPSQLKPAFDAIASEIVSLRLAR
jgi:Flp pilus assembly protein TadG